MKNYILVAFATLFCTQLFSQVGIGNTNPNASLDISASNVATPSNEDGLLIPRIDDFPSTNPTVAQDGMMVFITGNGTPTKGFYYWDHSTTSWIIFTGSTDADWYEVGGTSNPNNINDHIFTQGFVAIGSNNPANGQLDITSSYPNRTSSIYSEITGSTTSGAAQGIRNVLDIDGSALVYATTNRIEGNSNGLIQGFRNEFLNTGSGSRYALANYWDNFGTPSTTAGVYNRFGGSGSNNNFGIYNESVSGATINGDLIGLNNSFRNNGNSTIYGVYSEIISVSSGNKYGSYTSISSGSGGTHYGTYNDVQSTTGFAGFFRGRVSMGTGATNRYLMPEADGTAGQVMTTDGSGNVSFQTQTTGTDDQNLLTPTITGGTVLNLGIENGTGTSIDLAPIQDGTGTDDQTIDNFSLSGTTLRISLEDDGQPLQTVNLASLQDGTGTDDQNLLTPTITGGTVLNLGIENGTGTSIDLAPIQDGTGTDDQNIQNLAFNTTTNILTVGIENGTSQNVNLSSLDSGGDILGVGAGDGLIGGGATGNVVLNANANNGLNVDTTADAIQWGGALTENTIITFGNFDTRFNLSGSGDFIIQDTGIGKWQINSFGDEVIGGGSYWRQDNIAGAITATLLSNAGDATLNLYDSGTIDTRISGSGNSFFNAGNTSFGSTAASATVDIVGSLQYQDGNETAGNILTSDALGNASWAAPSTLNLVSANNGLTETTNTVRLGGALNQNTTITQNNFDMVFNVNNNGTFKVQDAGTDKFEMNTFGDAVFGGGTFWRNGSTSTANDILGRFISSGNSGIFDVYTGANLQHRITAAGNTNFNILGLDQDFIIESDLRNNMLYVDAGEDIVRIANTTGGLAQDGNSRTVNGITFNVDYVANISDGGIGSTVGIGTAEFITDGGNQIAMVDANWTPFNDDDDALGSSAYRWTAVWATDGTINTSDINLKKNIKPLDYGLEALMNVETITYQWKNSVFNDQKIGFSAQNLKNIIPEVVRDYDILVTNEETNSKIKVPSSKLGVYYSDIIPVTVKAIQELNEKNEKLTKEVKELKEKLSQYENLDARLSAIENRNTPSSEEIVSIEKK